MLFVVTAYVCMSLLTAFMVSGITRDEGIAATAGLFWPLFWVVVLILIPLALMGYMGKRVRG